MSTSILLLSFISSIALCQNVCRWYDDQNDLTLDLTPVYGQKLTFVNPMTPQYNYQYTICENGLYCETAPYPPQQVSIGQYEGLNTCYDTGIYNPDVQPTYVQENDDTYWSFTYTGSDEWSCFDVPRRQVINWFCDPNANEPVITSQIEDPLCVYTMNISYVGACEEIPAQNCVYNDPGTNSTFNLTDYVGSTFRYDDGDDVFEYSPCANSLLCQYTPDGMVNYQTFGACYMVAIFDYRIEPVRSTDTDGQNTYTFFYDNGIGAPNECENGISTLINWHCDRSPIRSPRMIAKRIGFQSCQFQIDMYSNDACIISF